MKNEKGLFIKNPNFWRIPRKLKKKIPKNTHYCYIPTSGFGKLKDGRYGFTIKTCHFFKHEKYKDMKPQPDWIDDEFLEEHGEVTDGWCKLIKGCIEDQCKSCGLKD